MLDSDLLRKKIKFDGKDTGEPLSYCQFCKAYTIMDLQSDCCQKCGSIVGELDVQADEKFTEKPKYIPHGQTYWGLQRYDAEVSRDYLIRRHIKDLSCKIEIPEFMQRNVETLVKKLINKNPKLAKSLKNIVVSCIFLNMRQKDPAYSIKNFSEVADMKPKTVLKHMNTIKPFFFEDEHIFLSSSQRASSGNHEAYLLNFVQKLDLKQLLSPESDLGLSLMTIREEHKENLKLERIFGSENILPQQGSTYSSAYKKLEDIIKSKITKYGSFLINSDFLFSTKFGKNVNNFVISLVVVILRAFSIPITMKKLCEIEEVSLISISRMAKDMTIKIMDEYMNQLELLSTTQQTFDSTQVSTLSEDKEGDKEGDSKGKEEDEESCAKKSKNDDTLKKAIKLLYKKCPYQN